MSEPCDAATYQYIGTFIILLIVLWFMFGKVLDNNYNTDGCRAGFRGIDYEQDTEEALVQYTPDRLKYTNFDAVEVIPEDDHKELRKKTFAYPLPGGLYGDVPVYLYGPNDVAHREKWYTDSAIYLPNSRLWWEGAKPKESEYW